MLAAPVRRGEVLTDVRLVGPALADAVPGETVLPVRLPDAGMATLLRAGDEVDLVATDPGTGDTAVVARDVTVLATPTGVPDGPAGGSGGALVVVSASPTEAIAIASAGALAVPDGVLEPLACCAFDSSAALSGPHTRRHIMSGFKNFILKGNLIEIATGLIMALAFASVVTTFTAWLTGLMPDTAADLLHRRRRASARSSTPWSRS